MQTARTTPERRTSLVAGILFLITFIASIPALALFQPVLDDPAGWIAGSGGDGRIELGALLELVTILANIGSAIVLFPLLRRRDEALSLGYVGARVVECTFMAAGLVAVLAIVSLRTDDPGAGTLAVSLAATKDWTFLLGPGVMSGLGTGLILGTLLYRARLLPRPMTMLGIIGGPLLAATGIAVLFGVIEAGGFVQSLATAPELLWELLLGLVLTFRGFAPAVSGTPRTRRGRARAASGAPDPHRAADATAATR
ncbi:MAG TPA: DUF4386 domain-containing protein [Miltoncostaea sp.]|nr:DUF4386 domain-containing protein [Miltoncostaea sp.]